MINKADRATFTNLSMSAISSVRALTLQSSDLSTDVPPFSMWPATPSGAQDALAPRRRTLPSAIRTSIGNTGAMTYLENSSRMVESGRGVQIRRFIDGGLVSSQVQVRTRNRKPVCHRSPHDQLVT